MPLALRPASGSGEDWNYPFLPETPTSIGCARPPGRMRIGNLSLDCHRNVADRARLEVCLMVDACYPGCVV
jgi:hypothetical protein